MNARRIKFWLLFVGVVLVACSTLPPKTHAADQPFTLTEGTIATDGSNAPTGYRLYEQSATGAVTLPDKPGTRWNLVLSPSRPAGDQDSVATGFQAKFTLTNVSGTHTFCATEFNSVGESTTSSNTVTVTILTGVPNGPVALTVP